MLFGVLNNNCPFSKDMVRKFIADINNLSTTCESRVKLLISNYSMYVYGIYVCVLQQFR